MREPSKRPPLPWTTPWSGTISLIAVVPAGFLLGRVGVGFAGLGHMGRFGGSERESAREGSVCVCFFASRNSGY